MTSDSLRRQLELRAGPLIILLAKLPRFVPFLLVMALLLAGLFFQGLLGGVLLLVLAALLGVLLLFGWPALDGQSRVIRLVVVAVVAIRGLTFLF